MFADDYFAATCEGKYGHSSGAAALAADVDAASQVIVSVMINEYHEWVLLKHCC